VEYKKITGRPLCLGLQRKVTFSLVVTVVLVTLLMAMMFLTENLPIWWDYIIMMYVTSVTVLLPLVWMFTCAALTKVATELAGDIEKVRNEKYSYQEYDEV